MTPEVFAAVAALGLVAGLLIGCIGVGGVIIVPAFEQLLGIPIRTAIGVAVAGYILTGLVGTFVYLRQGTLVWRDARVLCLTAMPAAIAGTLAARAASPVLLELVIALMTLSSGVYAVFDRRRGAPPAAQHLSTGRGVALGTIAGFLSALTGTGGPAVLLPLLLWLDMSAVKAIGLAQVIQLPIAGLATLTNAVSSQIDLRLSLALGSGLVIGAWFGAKLPQKLDPVLLRRMIALALIAVGLAMFLKAIRAGIV